MRPRTVCLIALLFTASGCSLDRMVADNSLGLMGHVQSEFLDEPSVRYARDAAPGLLKLLDGLVAASPDNPELLVFAASMNAQFAFGLVEEEDPVFARSLYHKAWQRSLRALGDERLDDILHMRVDEVQAALADHGEEDLPAIFWCGLALSGWLNLDRESMESVASFPNALAMVERAMALDPAHFYGAAHLLQGRFHGERSAELGGNPAQAKASFEEALRVNDGRLLLARVYMALYFAVPRQDTALFRKELDAVMEASDDILPGARLLTAIAKKKAEELLLSMDDYFLEIPDKDRY